MDQNQPIDQDALRMARAISLAESGRDGKPNYNAIGDNKTSRGAYQFQEATWNDYSKRILGSVADMTPENQDKVAYGMVKKWKDSGKKPEEIASMWNAGEGRPDAWQNHKGRTTINGKVISYDTPDYVRKVKGHYDTLGGVQQVQQVPQEQPAPEAPQTPYTGAMGTNPNDSTYGKIIDNSITREIMDFFPGKKTGEAIGTLGGLGMTAAKEAVGAAPAGATAQYDTSAPTPLQVAGDVAQGALMVAPGMGGRSVFGKVLPNIPLAGSALGRIGQAGVYGGGLGLSGSLAEGNTDIGTLAKDTGRGALTGAVTGGLGEVANVAGKYGPGAYQNIMGNKPGMSGAQLAATAIGSPAGIPGILTSLAVQKVLASKPVKKLVTKTLQQLVQKQGLARAVIPYTKKKQKTAPR